MNTKRKNIPLIDLEEYLLHCSQVYLCTRHTCRSLLTPHVEWDTDHDQESTRFCRSGSKTTKHSFIYHTPTLRGWGRGQAPQDVNKFSPRAYHILKNQTTFIGKTMTFYKDFSYLNPRAEKGFREWI